MTSKGHRLRLGRHTLLLGPPTRIMGILNVTPDSFSDGGRFIDPRRAIAHGRELWRQGADVVDVGGESTRPGATELSADEEIERVVPVIQGLVEAGVDVLSIDTRKARVAEAALAAGAVMVNDVSAGDFDADMYACVAASGAAYVAMHSRDVPQRMQQGQIHYDDVVEDVARHLGRRLERALGAGICRDRVVLDPGIGFGKTVEHNLALTRGLSRIGELGVPVLYGPSRKSFLGRLLGGLAPSQRLEATLSAISVAVLSGADMVRVHDVMESKRALSVADALAAEEPSNTSNPSF